MSILEENDFEFPEPFELKLRLKDVLESTVDESFYLNDEQTKRLRMTTFHSGKEENRVQDSDGECRTLLARDYKDAKCVRVGGLYDGEQKRHQAGSVYDPDGISATLSTMQGGNQEPIIVANSANGGGVALVDDIYKNRPPRPYTETAPTIRANHAGDLKVMPIRTANKKGYEMASDGDGVDLSYPQSKTKRGRVGHGVSKTLMGADCMGTVDNYRIRKLTPKECWRLMGFDDSDFEKTKAAGVSNSQLYKQAGNSICVGVLEGILKNLLLNFSDKES